MKHKKAGNLMSVKFRKHKNAGNFRMSGLMSGPDPLRFLRVALHIEISTRCVFCVAGRIFMGFLSLPNLVLKLNLNMPKRLRVEASENATKNECCESTKISGCLGS